MIPSSIEHIDNHNISIRWSVVEDPPYEFIPDLKSQGYGPHSMMKVGIQQICAWNLHVEDTCHSMMKVGIKQICA